MVNLSAEAGHCLTMRSYCFNWTKGTWETGDGPLILHGGKEEEEQKVEEGKRGWCVKFRGGVCVTTQVIGP